jgi:hypothetical protein
MKNLSLLMSALILLFLTSCEILQRPEMVHQKFLIAGITGKEPTLKNEADLQEYLLNEGYLSSSALRTLAATTSRSNGLLELICLRNSPLQQGDLEYCKSTRPQMNWQVVDSAQTQIQRGLDFMIIGGDSAAILFSSGFVISSIYDTTSISAESGTRIIGFPIGIAALPPAHDCAGGQWVCGDPWMERFADGSYSVACAPNAWSWCMRNSFPTSVNYNFPE